jgi:hypothetical protein
MQNQMKRNERTPAFSQGGEDIWAEIYGARPISITPPNNFQISQLNGRKSSCVSPTMPTELEEVAPRVKLLRTLADTVCSSLTSSHMATLKCDRSVSPLHLRTDQGLTLATAVENLVPYSLSQPAIFKTNEFLPIKDLKLLVRDYKVSPYVCRFQIND